MKKRIGFTVFFFFCMTTFVQSATIAVNHNFSMILSSPDYYGTEHISVFEGNYLNNVFDFTSDIENLGNVNITSIRLEMSSALNLQIVSNTNYSTSRGPEGSFDEKTSNVKLDFTLNEDFSYLSEPGTYTSLRNWKYIESSKEISEGYPDAEFNFVVNLLAKGFLDLSNDELLRFLSDPTLKYSVSYYFQQLSIIHDNPFFSSEIARTFFYGNRNIEAKLIVDYAPVDVSKPVPEPATILLFGLGLLGLTGVTRKQI